jgi:geranylgeranyl diphosphate synthase type I
MVPSAEDITSTYLSAIEAELHHAVRRADIIGSTQLYDMLAYHMGWKDKHSKIETRGKRFRPLLVLLTCSASGGDWHGALPAAAAVELVHNFSLIHDDIEDHSPLRRGRPTVWKKWGIPQAINTGDAMFTLAHLQSVRLADVISHASALKAIDILQQACLQLTQGQYLDLVYEKRDEVTIEEYWAMVEGKTATLIAVSAELGALTASCDEQTCQAYRKFGHLLGLAFQVQDDILGIWGNAISTGKSNQSDLLTKKKTLPVLYGLSRNGKFAEHWKRGPVIPEEINEIIRLLEIDGGKEFAQIQAKELTTQVLSSLEEAHPSGYAGETLKNLVLSLVNRQI